MRTRLFLSIVFVLIWSLTVQGQKIATIEVDLSKPMKGLTIPASIDLDAITLGLLNVIVVLNDLQPNEPAHDREHAERHDDGRRNGTPLEQLLLVMMVFDANRT